VVGADRGVLLVGNGGHVVPGQFVERIAAARDAQVVVVFDLRGVAGQDIEVVAAPGTDFVVDRVFVQETRVVVFVARSVAAFVLLLGGQVARFVVTPVALVGVVGELAAQLQPLDGREFHESVVGERYAPCVLEAVVEHDARVVEFLARVPQVVHARRGVEERTEEDGRVPPVGSADRGQVLVLVAVGVAQIQSGLEPFGELVVDLEACRIAFQPAVVDDALCFVVADRGVVGALSAGSREGEVVVLIERRACDLVDPVRAPAFGFGIGVGIFRHRRVGFELLAAVGACEVVGVVVAVAGELRGVHDVEPARELRESQVGFEGDAGASVDAAALLGRDDDDAVRAACAVDGRR